MNRPTMITVTIILLGLVTVTSMDSADSTHSE